MKCSWGGLFLLFCCGLRIQKSHCMAAGFTSPASEGLPKMSFRDGCG